MFSIMALWLISWQSRSRCIALILAVLALQPFPARSLPIPLAERTCPDSDINFYLYTRSNPNNGQEMRIAESLEKSNLGSYFNSSLPVKVIIHGYNANMFLSQLMKMKTEYLARGSYNLIYVDWSELASGSWYPSVVSNTPHVGTCIGQMVKRITEAGASDVHVIGFSLGAHVANYVSTTVRPLRIQRITGLDPAVNSIFGKPIDDRLDPSDAEFVDVFHTNALMQGKIGTCGHADFYFNGGSVQPGCWKRDFLACNHHRALDYYAESIRSQTKFWGWSCKSYFYYAFSYCEKNLQVVAGEDCPSDARGTFMLSTNAESPFAMGR